MMPVLYKRLMVLSLWLVMGVAAAALVYVYLNFGPRQANYYFTKSTSLAGETIGGYSLNQDITGLSLSPSLDHNHEKYLYYSVPNGPSIITPRGDTKIIRIWAMNSEGQSKTSKGIKIGSLCEEAVLAYGSHYYRRSEQGVNVIGYIDKTLDHTLEFWLYEDKVTAIRLDFAEMD